MSRSVMIAHLLYLFSLLDYETESNFVKCKVCQRYAYNSSTSCHEENKIFCIYIYTFYEFLK